MSGFQTLLYDKTGSLAHIALNRPGRLNVYNLQMRDELFEVLCAIRDDAEVRVVLLRGAGEKAFCAGADLTEFLSAPSPVIARHVRWERDVWGLFLSLPQPLIAAVHGYCFGSGLEMALCCDLRLASEDAQFAVPEGLLGIIPAAGATQTLPRTVGRAKAIEALLTSDRIDAHEALRVGLVNSVVPREELLVRAEDIADTITSHHHGRVKHTKDALRRGIDMSLLNGFQMERRVFSSPVA
jgi:enoyl-CoA hydratase/carnithine racemase